MNIDENTVIEAVSECIQGRTPGGATLKVMKEGIRHEQEWWYVPIQPSIQPAHRYEYYEALAEVENALLKSYQLTVLLVPVQPVSIV